MVGWSALRVPWAGLLAGPAAVVVNLQASYAMAGWTCAAGSLPILAISTMLLMVALGGAWLSWRAWHDRPHDVPLDDSTSRQPLNLIAAGGVFLGCLFSLVIVLQASATFVLDGCIR